MRYDAWCSYIPYLDHLAPLWHGLPEAMRGTVYVTPSVLEHAVSLGLDVAYQAEYREHPRPFLVFSRSEFRSLPSGPIVFVEHGVGPSYDGKSHLISRSNVPIPPVLGVLTTPANAPAHRALLGDGYVHEIGCPKLDAYYGNTYERTGTKPVVAFSHHWEERAYPEARSAWPWDAQAWERIAASGAYDLLGHKHPGDKRDIEGWCAEIGATFEPSFDDVMVLADLFVADNSSTLYEFSATGRPVVVLSPPFYRRTVDHGLRFWRDIPGVECSHPEHLGACIAEALLDVPERRALREMAVERAYGPQDGKATERAVAVLTRIAQEHPEPIRVAPTPRPTPLHYPVHLANAVVYAGKTWPKGTVIDRATAVAMKQAGVLKDARIC